MMNNFDTLGMGTMCPLTRDQANLAALAGLDDDLADAAIARMTDEELAGVNDAAVDLHAAGETARMGSAGRRCRCRQRKAVRELKRRYAGSTLEIRDVPPKGLGMYEPPHNPELDPADFDRWAALSEDNGMDGLGSLGKSIFSKIGKFFSNVGKAVAKVAAPVLGVVGGALLGPVAGAVVSGVGSVVGGGVGYVSPNIGQAITDATATAGKSLAAPSTSANSRNPLQYNPYTGSYIPYTGDPALAGQPMLYWNPATGRHDIDSRTLTTNVNYGAWGSTPMPGVASALWNLQRSALPAATGAGDPLAQPADQPFDWSLWALRTLRRNQETIGGATGIIDSASTGSGFMSSGTSPAANTPSNQNAPQPDGGIDMKTIAIGGGIALAALLLLRR